MKIYIRNIYHEIYIEKVYIYIYLSYIYNIHARKI